MNSSHETRFVRRHLTLAEVVDSLEARYSRKKFKHKKVQVGSQYTQCLEKKLKRTVKKLVQKCNRGKRHIQKLRAAVERQRLKAAYGRAQRKACRAKFRNLKSRNKQLERDNRQLYLQLAMPTAALAVDQEHERQDVTSAENVVVDISFY